MTIATGTLLGPYEILAPLGAGAMGASAGRRRFPIDRRRQPRYLILR